MAAAHESPKARDSTNVETERTFQLEAGQSYDTMAESHRAFHSLELEAGAEVAVDAAVEADSKRQKYVKQILYDLDEQLWFQNFINEVS